MLYCEDWHYSWLFTHVLLTLAYAHALLTFLPLNTASGASGSYSSYSFLTDPDKSIVLGIALYINPFLRLLQTHPPFLYVLEKSLRMRASFVANEF